MNVQEARLVLNHAIANPDEGMRAIDQAMMTMIAAMTPPDPRTDRRIHDAIRDAAEEIVNLWWIGPSTLGKANVVAEIIETHFNQAVAA
jgi:hypothetical protein